MNEPRPYPQTEWEEEQKSDADAAVVDAQVAVENADDAVAHANETMSILVETSKEIAANTTAVEKLTRESLIADNKKFRRRNAVLVFLTSVLIVAVGYLVYRDVFINAPQRDNLVEISETLQECTTPGPRTPTADDPSTGHKCFDDGQARTGEAIAAIVDADGNGQVDAQEILAAIERFEVFLGVPGD